METIDNSIDKLPLTIGNGTMDKSRPKLANILAINTGLSTELLKRKLAILTE